MIFLCEIITKFSKPNVQTSLLEIKFGNLFDLYSSYSDKVRTFNTRLLALSGDHVAKEVLDVCEYLAICGHMDSDGITSTRFAKIFALYEGVSNKVMLVNTHQMDTLTTAHSAVVRPPIGTLI